jgi:hypothetical protein
MYNLINEKYNIKIIIKNINIFNRHFLNNTYKKLKIIDKL